MSEINIQKKISKARAMLAAMELKKSGYNSGYDYNYFELKDFLPQTLKICDEIGLCPVFSMGLLTVENELLGEKISKPYASLEVFDSDNPENSITFSSVVEESWGGGSPLQNLSAQRTYMRRILYMEFMEVSETETIDSRPTEKEKAEYSAPLVKKVKPASKPKPKKTADNTPCTADQVRLIADNAGEKLPQILKQYKAEAIEDLTIAQASDVIEFLVMDE